MNDLDEHSKACEKAFGLISRGMLWGLHEICKRHGSKWELEKPETIEIPVNKENAADVYAWCKAIRSGYSVGLGKNGMKKIKEARLEAHKFLYEEANDPNTSIERKIELVNLTSKTDKNKDL